MSMPHLVIIFGPPAVGKAAVGYELAVLTGFRLFHNHLTAEPVAALFDWGSARFNRLVDELRLMLLDEASKDPQLPGVIFTLVWDLQNTAESSFVEKIKALFEASSGNVYFVELHANINVRLSHEGTPLRLSLKPAKRDIAAARQLIIDTEGKYKLNSDGDFSISERHLKLNTEHIRADQNAARIVTYWSLPITTT